MCADHSRSSSDSDDRFDGSTVEAGQETLTVNRLSDRHSGKLATFFRGLEESSAEFFDPHRYDPETVGLYVQRSDQHTDESYVAVNTSGDVVAYFFLWEADRDVPLLGIGIADAYQNRGLGRRLMRLLIERARELGKTGIDLTTMQTNDRAYHLYETCGFHYVDDVPNIVGDGRTVVERRMFLPLRDGATPPERKFGPPEAT